MRFLSLLISFACACASAFSQTYEQLFEQGVAAAQADSLQQAADLFQQALRQSPGDYRNSLVLTNLGQVQERLQHFDAAIRATPEQWFWYNRRWVLDPVAESPDP